jgi:predicted GNAT family N-acyltransferase
LNDFLFNDALDYHRQLMGVTYLIVDEANDAIVAYFTLSNDKITKDEDERPVWNRISRPLPNRKRREYYPAVKIGRLAVNSRYERQGLGYGILTSLKMLFVSGNRTGCRFITVDAYRVALPFYEKCGFSYMTEKDGNDTTRLMYFDLKSFLP